MEAIEIASPHTGIDIDSFAPRAEIDRRFYDTPYYVPPNDPVGQDAFVVIGRRCAARRWWRSAASCWPNASG